MVRSIDICEVQVKGYFFSSDATDKFGVLFSQILKVIFYVVVENSSKLVSFRREEEKYARNSLQCCPIDSMAENAHNATSCP